MTTPERSERTARLMRDVTRTLDGSRLATDTARASLRTQERSLMASDLRNAALLQRLTEARGAV